MPEVKIGYAKITDPEAAKKPPKKPPVAIGTYKAVIASAPLGVTKGTPLQKLAVEFQIVCSAENGDMTETGRRVYQDYVLEPDPAKPDWDDQRRFELRSLLDASGIKYSEGAFNNDHLVGCTVLISVIHRLGKEVDPDTQTFPKFANISKVDTAETINPDELV